MLYFIQETKKCNLNFMMLRKSSWIPLCVCVFSQKYVPYFQAAGVAYSYVKGKKTYF